MQVWIIQGAKDNFPNFYLAWKRIDFLLLDICTPLNVLLCYEMECKGESAGIMLE